MKTITTLLLSIFFCLPILAQSDFADKKYYLIDSLVLDDLSNSDSLIIEQNLKKYHDSKTDTAKLYFLEQIIANSWNQLVWVKYNETLYKECNELINTSTDAKVIKKVKYFLAIHYGNNGYLQDIQGNFDKALAQYNKSLELFIQVEALDGIANIYHALAGIYDVKGDVKKAIDTYQEAIKVAEKANDYSLLAAIFNNVGVLQQDNKEYDLALANFNKAIEIAKKINDKRKLGNTLNKKAIIFFQLNQFAEAKSLQKKAKAYLEEVDANEDILQNKMLEANIFLKEQKYDSTLLTANEIVKIAEKYEILEINFSGLYTIAKVLFLEKKYSSAYTKAKEALQIAKQTERISHLSKINKLLSDITYSQNKFKESRDYFNHFNTWSDSILNDKTKSEAIKLSLKYDYQKQKEIDDLKSQQEIEIAEEKAQRNLSLLIAALALTLLIGVVSAFLLYRAKQKKQQELLALKLVERTKQFELEKEVLVSKLKALRSQMNPHFIFNLLNSIQHLVLKGDIENAYNFINQFAGLVRNVLDYSDKEKIWLSEELQLLQVYLKLEKLRFNDNLEYEIIEKNTDKDVLIPPMLIQPFIENALVHGLLHKENSRQLKVTIAVEDVLVCTIEDNGIGRKKAKEIRQRQRGNHKSFSTAAIEKRFAILSDYYKEELGYTYYDLPPSNAMTTQVVLRIPYDVSLR